ncbi:sensor histidine kinase [Polaribacter pacificus]|uniref:sensor histidine kinase n=1 Tax=Polaribacter pacificus TaxID=1775173 RepID=UPI00166F3BF0|nr:histidine kinase [Polaribacter pacificus]
MFKKIANLANVGIYPTTVKSEIKRIKVVNYCIIVGLANLFFFFLVETVLQQITFQSFLSFVSQSVMIVSALYLQKKERYTSARLLLLFFSFSILFYNANFAYTGFYGEYMYILIPLVSLFFFESKLIYFSALVICILSFYVPNSYLNIYPDLYFGYLNAVFLFIGSFAIVYYFKKQNKKNEDYLEKAYSELEKRQKGELAHLQLKSLKAQMNPHFMFNAMNSIQSLVLKGDKYEAYNYLTKFASLIRENLNMSEKSFVGFDEELSLLKKYLELEKLRFRDDFEYEIVDEHEIEDIKIPSMIIQPFIENAIKHGLLHKINGVKKVKIQFYFDDVFTCVITDNGIGLEASKAINDKNLNKETSFSTKAIQERLALLKKYYNSDIGFTYQDIEEGTQVVLKIPYTR